MSFLSNLPAPQQRWLSQVQAQAARMGLSAYLVGGIVRDLLLGQPGLDLDIVIEGDALVLAKALQAEHGGLLTTHQKFRTATWQIPDGPTLDLITARREHYPTPACLPEVTPASLQDDLVRRDFSINTLALRLSDGALIDQHHAQRDLQEGVIRILHPASFHDDPTRLYRAVRYETRYGFHIHAETLGLIPGALHLVEALSPERIRHELDLILLEPHAVQTLARLNELGLLKAILDVLPWDSDLASRLDSALGQPPGPEWGLNLPAAATPLKLVVGYSLWFCSLTHAQIALLQQRLAFPLSVLRSLQAASTLTAELPGLSLRKPSEWAQKLTGSPIPALYAVYCQSAEEALKRYVTHWQHIHPKTTGDTLKTLGLPPGPRYQQILWQLRAARLDGLVTSDEEETLLLKQMLKFTGDE